jgi:hypothetical protein
VRIVVFLLLLLWSNSAFAQGAQCRTSPVGTSTSYCGSEAFVTDSIAAIPAGGNVTGPATSTAGHVATFADGTGKIIADGGAVPAGTVTEQKNTFGYGISSSGNCDNTSTNAASPCNAVVSLSVLTNALSGNVALNNTGTFFDGPTVAQGTSGTWWASGSVMLQDTAGAATMVCKLWDGTTVISAGVLSTTAANGRAVMTLSGYLASPAANIKISCQDGTSTSGFIVFNGSGTSKDSNLSVHRIQ